MMMKIRAILHFSISLDLNIKTLALWRFFKFKIEKNKIDKSVFSVPPGNSKSTLVPFFLKK